MWERYRLKEAAMSLNGIMGVGLSSAGAQNPWDANSPAAVDFRRPEGIEAKGEVKTGIEPPVPADYVTLHSGEAQVGSAAADAAAVDEAGSTFRMIA
jgi:hypothetical protein